MNFADLVAEADRRWKSLTDGETPWIRVGAALCGKAAGCDAVLAALESSLQRHGVAARISEVGCLGPCFAEPLVDVQLPGGSRVIYRNVTPESAEAIVAAHVVQGTPVPGLALGYLGESSIGGIPPLVEHPMKARETRIALRNAGNIDPGDIYQYIANGGYQALNQSLTTMTAAEMLAQVNASGLRGRGGAAFATGTKWNFLAGSREPVKYVLCNCEEGDPGAFNDKGILESDPHTVVEGIILAGYATGASNGYIFIRHGHDGPVDRARNAVRQAYELGLLGQNILGSDYSFDLEVALTGDSYVSGEETALMESIEGKRSMPRYRPPFPAQVGLFGQPTNINNVKTLAYVPEIVARGGAWFSSIGHGRSTGTAILCLSGPLNYTGMVEVPMGLNLSEVLYEVAGGVRDGKNLKLVQTGGPLGGVLGVDNIDLALDFEVFRDAGAILGSGGIIAADEDTCIVDLTRALIAFCQYESCGKCFPCRMGMSHLLEVLERICRLEGECGDLELMRSVGLNMQAGSLCGHGQLGFNPVSSAIKYFGPEFDAHILERRCPTGTCLGAKFSPKLTRR
ncbi:MAG TPA: NADH-ubiquinone oxidoreductase-F iron-sulfur binding region domain-containing protein [Dehalococcoidia bacterium]|nr:NADH-ubiquinone oxidoreductase-F iron-sulfur binding region domain-containing protein [Dehalococcoidia bacterium]